MRFHVVSLADSQTTKAWDYCALTANARKFADMMWSLGHEVYLYASEENDAACTELVTVVTKQEQKDLWPATKWDRYDMDAPLWKVFNSKAIAFIAARLEPHDFICIIGGWNHHPIARAFPSHQVVEFAIGYRGVLWEPNVHHVFASNALRSQASGVHGEQLFKLPEEQRGQNKFGGGHYYPDWYDRVIPHYFNPADFPYQEHKDKDPYFIFLGRPSGDKGWGVAIEVAKELDTRLVICGEDMGRVTGAGTKGVDVRGLVGPKERAKLLGGARASFIPSTYLEPFGCTTVESLLCGTPIITTDWGSFPEINEQGVTGYRCNTFADFVAAAFRCLRGFIEPEDCRKKGMTYSMWDIRYKYESYFSELLTLWEKGWYT